MNKPSWKNTFNRNEKNVTVRYLLDCALVFGYDYAALNGRVYDVTNGQDICSVEALDDEHNALVRIAAWDLPSTGKFWDDGDPMSYGACYGSHGERDFMIGLAKDVLGDVA